MIGLTHFLQVPHRSPMPRRGLPRLLSHGWLSHVGVGPLFTQDASLSSAGNYLVTVTRSHFCETEEVKKEGFAKLLDLTASEHESRFQANPLFL